MFRQKAQPWMQLGATNEERNEKSPGLDIFTAGIRDNPTILPEEIDVIETIFVPGTPEHGIRVLGRLLPSVAGSLAYPGFMRPYHMTNLTRHHVIPQLPLVLSVDFNAANGCWIVGQRVGRVFRVLDEITMEQSDVASMAFEFRARFPSHASELWLYGDSTGRRRDSNIATSSFHLLHSYLYGYPVPIRFKLPDLNPSERDRVDTVNMHLQPATGERLIEMASHLERLPDDLETAKWLKNGKLDKRTEQLDAADCLGYWIHFEVPTHRGLSMTSSLRSVKSPTYTPSKGVFPATRSVRASRKLVSRILRARIPGAANG